MAGQKGTTEPLRWIRRMTDRTVLIVTHRPQVREACDRVWVLNETGTVE